MKRLRGRKKGVAMDVQKLEVEVMEVIRTGKVMADRHFFDECYAPIESELPNEPTDEELFMQAENERYDVYPDKCNARMPIQIVSSDGKRFVLYQDVWDGEVYDAEAEGHALGENIRDLLIAKGEAFEGTLQMSPKRIIEFVVGNCAENFKIELKHDDGSVW